MNVTQTIALVNTFIALLTGISEVVNKSITLAEEVKNKKEITEEDWENLNSEMQNITKKLNKLV